MTNSKQDIRYHEILKQAAIYSYHKEGSYPPAGYRVIDFDDNKETGFYADVLSNGNDIIIAYRGTESGQDIRNDIAMAKSKIPAQTTDAIRIYDKVKREYPNVDITVTGHSLGGSLAEIVSGIRGCLAVTFNAYGVRNMFRNKNELIEDNVVNYVNEWDPIAMANGENLVGDIYAVRGKFGHFAHFIDDFEPLFNREGRTHEDIKRHKSLTDRLRNKAMYSKEQITNTTEQVINKFKQISNNTIQCVGSYQVSGYTRSDGIKVDGYIRRCGAKHDK